jgi:hypothetical protein
MQHEIALFFDNEEKNLINARDVCPNVIPIKVPDTIPFSMTDGAIIANNCVSHYNSLDEGARRFYACLIAALRISIKGFRSVDQMVELFDSAAGISEKIMDNVISALNDPEFNSKYAVKTCIFDIDRTIIKNEGFLDTKHIKSIERIMKMIDDAAIAQQVVTGIDVSTTLKSTADLNNVSLNTDLKAEKDKITILDVAHCFLGGVDRTNALVRFFGELRAKNVNVVFLTNNSGYCTSDIVNKRCPAAIDVAAKVSNSNYNWLFYDFMVGAGIITADKDYFIANMMIYNNSGSMDAIAKGPSKYNRIHNMQMDGTMADHKLKQACKTTLGADMVKITTEIKGLIEDDFVVIGGRKKTRKTRGRGKKTKKMSKTRSRGKKMGRKN